tara:strand:- start:1969 stop:2217 length:249 start_codon:yes stop_codon:yes gene_type:complete
MVWAWNLKEMALPLQESFMPRRASDANQITFSRERSFGLPQALIDVQSGRDELHTSGSTRHSAERNAELSSANQNRDPNQGT